MRRNISVTNTDVNKILDRASERNEASKLIEDAVLFYTKYKGKVENIITVSCIEDMLGDIDAFKKDASIAREIMQVLNKIN